MLADYKCPRCTTIYENRVRFGEETMICEKCNITCERLPSFDAKFKLKYNNRTDKCSWAAENYASSQYWREYDKQKKGNIFVQGGTKE
jgi:hypothetical protein